MEPYYEKTLLGSFIPVALTTSSQEILSSNPRRVSLTFPSSAVGRYTVWFGGGVAIVDKGVNIQGGIAPVTLTRAELGSLIEQSVAAIGQVANINIGVIEVSTP